MNQKVKPKITIVLDRERTLLLNLNAMIDFEEATGKSLLTEKPLQNPTAKDLRALLWACLRHEDKELTLEDAGNLLDMSDFGDSQIVDKLLEAWGVAMPQPRKRERPLAMKPQNGTG